MKGDITSARKPIPPIFKEWRKVVRLETQKYASGLRSTPPFWIVQP